MIAAPISAVSAVDAAAWLTRYVELGGGYTVGPSGLIMHWSLRTTEEERRALVQQERALRRDMAMREAVRSYLASRTPMEEAE